MTVGMTLEAFSKTHSHSMNTLCSNTQLPFISFYFISGINMSFDS